MRSFQAVLVILMAAILNMARSAPGFHGTAIAVTNPLVDTVTSSGLQHSVAPTPGHADTSWVLMLQTNQTGACFHDSNFTRAENDTSAWVPWTALANQYDPGSEMALFYTFTMLCERISATIMTRDIPVNWSRPKGVRHSANHVQSTPNASSTATPTARTESSHR